MADFRQLALEFVLADDEAQLTSLAKQAASELQNAAAPTNPVARWVEAVQPWMPGSNGDEEMMDSPNSPDWTARAKALDFLSRTLDFLRKDLLKPSQVKLLISFFGAMFDIDHKAGILASATALSRIVAMKSFQPSSSIDIIQKVCALKDDFPRQVSKTRLAIFELLRTLITSPETSRDLQSRQGTSPTFMSDLLHLCQNERDPNCLMVWFEIITFFLREYSPEKEIVADVYSTFKAYFPITLPRASQSGITPDELKQRLRGCFSSNTDLAPHTFTFLLGKLDQGDGLTANVKLDVLKTVKQCIEAYQNPHDSVAPYFNQIWGSLKYEVRNGEVEDSIWATLEVLKTVAVKLEGDDLRDYCLTVTRDCVNDLANTLYAGPAGRLLVSVLSASPTAFVLMSAPVLTHIKENLRHPKAPSHSRDLFKLLQVVLETRIFLADAAMSDQERSDFVAIDAVFKNLYDEVFKTPVQLGSKEGASEDEIRLASEAVQGAGALVCQRAAGSTLVTEGSAAQVEKLLPEDTRLQVCDYLFSIITYWNSPSGLNSRSIHSDELINASINALQRAVNGNPIAFPGLVAKALELIHASEDKVFTINAFGSLLAYVGCSQLPKQPADGLKNFLTLITSIQVELVSAIDSRQDASIWIALLAGLQSTVRHFNDACLEASPARKSAWDPSWVSQIAAKYPVLDVLESKTAEDAISKASLPASPSDIYEDSLLSGLYIVRQLYRKATKANSNSLELDDYLKILGSDRDLYLHYLGSFAGFIFHQITEEQQLGLQAHQYALNLFHDDTIAISNQPAPSSIAEADSSWAWLISSRLNILSWGIIESLRPSSVSRLYELGVAQHVLLLGATVTESQIEPVSGAVGRSIMAVLSNRHKIETDETLITLLNQQAESVLKAAQSSAERNPAVIAQALALISISSGILRRYCGNQIQSLVQFIKAFPAAGINGGLLSQSFGLIIAPEASLTKENFGIAKPLWKQKVYFQLVKPMLEAALTVGDATAKGHTSTSVLDLIKHMDFPIYEEDADRVLRVCISTAQNQALASGRLASLSVLRNILIDAPAKGEPHLRSIIAICLGQMSANAAGAQDPESTKVALEIVVGLPRLVEGAQLLPHRPQVERELALACGNPVRELRRLARLARLAWAELN